jgi:CRP/FNR family transcriptional regulator
MCPNFHSFCLSTFSKELIHTYEMARAMGKKCIEEKLAMFLIGISIRMQELGYSGKEFNLSMSRDDIANFLGVASETVSREFTQLQKEGVLQVNRRWVCIESMESLEAMAE